MSSAGRQPWADNAGPAVGDGELVRRVRAGDATAFGTLYERHGRRMFRFVALRVGDEELAADLLQEIFLRALRALGTLRDADRFGAWVAGIGQHVIASHWAASDQRDRAHREPDDDDLEPPVEPGSDPVAALAHEHLEWARIQTAVAHLSEPQRAVVALRFSAGLSLHETAAVLDRTEDAVKQLQRRALIRLRALLSDEETRP